MRPADAALGRPVGTADGTVVVDIEPESPIRHRVQARCVDRLKRAALRQLHASEAGERLLLRMYLVAEETTVRSLCDEALADAPDWLRRQTGRHRIEEEGHVRAFATRLAEHDGRRAPAPTDDRPDWLSRRKIARWRRLARRHATRFESGLLVPAFAIGLCAEQMAARVLARHCSVVGRHHPFHPLLAGVLADETRHVRQCAATLQRLVAPHEGPALARLLGEVRAVDRAWGVAGAVALLVAGVALRLRRPWVPSGRSA